MALVSQIEIESNITSVEPFNRLVKLVARAFYDDIRSDLIKKDVPINKKDVKEDDTTTKGGNQCGMGCRDDRGIAVVVLDALTRRQWVREEDLAKDLKLRSNQLRRILLYFEEQKLVTRDQRKETIKGVKIFNAAVAATANGQQTRKKGENKIKTNLYSYCCLDYAQIYDVVRYRLRLLKKKLEDELENKITVQEYICPNCQKRYTSLDASRLVSIDDEYFHCENCNGALVVESHKLAPQGGNGDDNASRRRRVMLMEVQLEPLIEQLSRVEGLPVPQFGNLQAWEAHANAAKRATNGDSSAISLSKSSQGLGYGSTPMPFVGDTKVEVIFSGAEGKGEDIKSDSESTSQKVLPPWMIREGMHLTKEQRGEFKQESKMDASLATIAISDDKKSTIENDDTMNLQVEFVKAYCAALFKQKQELEEAAKKEQELSNTHSSDGTFGMTCNRQVGMKSKRDEDEGDDDVEWEEASVAGNVQANASGDDEDDIDWEEGSSEVKIEMMT